MGNDSAILLSEGTCYFGPGQKADPHFIPCGNVHLSGPLSCCYEGDYCLSSNTCWDAKTTVTYIAGCTDRSYTAYECPQRDNYPDQQWVALARCNAPNENLWEGCEHHPNQIALEKQNCECSPTSNNILVNNPNGKGAFDEIGLLPSATGLALEWNPTAIPTATPTANNSGLSIGAKAGIGVGVGIGGLLLIAGAVFGFVLLRRRRRNLSGKGDEDSEVEAREKPELDAERQTSELPPAYKANELGTPRGRDSAAELENTNGKDSSAYH